MQIKDFAVEQWMNEWETKCTYNVAETCVYSLARPAVRAYEHRQEGVAR